MVILKRVGVLKSAYFMGLYSAFIGFIFGLIFVMATMILSSIFSAASVGANSIGVESLAPNMFDFGWFSIILFPILYGIGGFILGIIFTPITNLILRIIKGIDVNLEQDSLSIVS